MKIKYNLFFFLSALYIYIMLLTDNPALANGFIAVLIINSFIDYRLMLSSYLMLAPIIGALETTLFLNISYAAIPILFFLFRIIFKKEKIFKIRIGVVFLALLLGLFLGSAFTGYNEYIHVLALLTITFSIVFIIIQLCIKNRENVFLIINSFILSGVIATIVTYSLSAGDIIRLSLGESIRQLANIVGMGIVTVSLFYIFLDQKPVDKLVSAQYKIFRLLRFPILIILVAGIIATMSRGVILALVISIAFMFGYYMLNKLKTLKLIPILISILGVVALIYFSAKEGESVLTDIGVDTERFSNRMNNEEINSGTSVRFKIWEAGISRLKGMEYIHGHGVSSFKMLAAKNGYDYYAHSIFVDTFVSAGIIGFLILIVTLIKEFKQIIRTKNYLFIALFIYLILSYLTHGRITSAGFWYIFAIIYGYVYSLNIKNETSLPLLR